MSELLEEVTVSGCCRRSATCRDGVAICPDFRAAQLAFAAHIRNPEVNPAPADIEPRRMKIYLELFYNNIENFLARGFPIARKCWEMTAGMRWSEICAPHPSESPYFLEISPGVSDLSERSVSVDLPDFCSSCATTSGWNWRSASSELKCQPMASIHRAICSIRSLGFASDLVPGVSSGPFTRSDRITCR